MKKIVVLGVLVLGGLWACKKTHLCSYASTLWNKGQHAVKGQIPRQFELDRVRNEIDKLDNDVRTLLGPIAEKQAALNRLERDIKTARVNHKAMREQLLALTQKVETGGREISWDGEEVSLDEAKARLAQEFAVFKAVDGNLKSREQVLAAQKQAIRLAHEQLRKISEQKSLFEARLAQLQATEENLNLQQIASPLRVDEGRVADIKNTLDAVEQGQEVEQQKRTLESQYGGRVNAGPRANRPSVNPQEIRRFLGQPTAAGKEKVASSK